MVNTIEIKCNICNTAFSTTPQQHYSQVHGGCPNCKYTSSLELKVSEVLNKNKIKHITQYTTEKCKHKSRLRFDFAILNTNDKVITIIEANGLQHYEPVSIFGGEKAFKSQQKRDQIKREYCKKNNIPLIEVRYDESDIPEYLTKALKAIDKA